MSDTEAVYLEVDKFIWNYIAKSVRFSSSYQNLAANCPVEIIEDPPGSLLRLVFKGENQETSESAKKDLELCVRECLDLVNSEKLPMQTEEVFQNIANNLETLKDAVTGQISLETDRVIVVTGTLDEVETTIGTLQELYGVVKEAENDSDETNQSQSLQLWKHESVEVDQGIWMYMQKSGSPWEKDISKLRKSKDVSIAENSIDDGKQTRIEITCARGNAKETAAKLADLIKQCTSVAKTVRTRKLDEKVFNKASRFAGKLNQSRVYVAAESGIFVVTGTDAEIVDCQGKLQKLGVTFDSEQPAASRRIAELKAETPDTLPAAASVDPTPATRSQDANADMTAMSASSSDFDGRVKRELPVPVEEALWTYFEQRKAVLLQELREAYGVTIQSIPTGQGFVCITLSADSTDMLDCGQDALIQTLQQMTGNIQAVVLQIDESQSVPQEMAVMFSQLADGTEAIVRVSGNKIIITGPQAAVAECQKRVAEFTQRQQRAGGYGLQGDSDGSSFDRRHIDGLEDGFGNAGGGGSYGGSVGGMGDMMPQDTMEDEDDDLGGFMGGRQSGRQLGGTGLPGGPENQDAIRNQRLQRLGADHQDTRSALKAEDRSNSSESRHVRFADEQSLKRDAGRADEQISDGVSHGLGCSVCQLSGEETGSSQGSAGKCRHAFCIPCVNEYFTDPNSSCPICHQIGDDDSESAKRRPRTQPRDGFMSVTYDKSFRLPGYETRSRGTIVVAFCFPPGVQKDFQPHPGQKYNGFTQTTFFPLNSDGSRVVDLLQRAFDEGHVFAMLPSSDTKTDEIAWNGIPYKTSIYTEPHQRGYPDPFFVHRLEKLLKDRGVK